MSQWDGMPELANLPHDLIGKAGLKARLKMTLFVSMMSKPPTDDEVREVNRLRYEARDAICTDPEFKPGLRVAEIEGELVSLLDKVEGLIQELGQQRGMTVWNDNPTLPYRPLPPASNGPLALRLQRPGGAVGFIQLFAVLREMLGIDATGQVIKAAVNRMGGLEQRAADYARMGQPV